MNASLNLKKITAIMVFTLVLILGLSSVTADIEAYAASMAKPVVTATNTAPTSVKLSWKKVKGAKKYIVYRSDKKSKGYKAVKTLTKTSYSNTKLTCGKKYYYKVVAVNGGKKVSSKVVTVTAKPAVVSGITTEGDCASVTISWAKASGVTGYEVYSVTDNAIAAAVKNTSYTQSGLVPASSVQYKIRAYKTVSKKKIYGAYSAVITAATSDEHTAAGSWTIVKKATCTQEGSKSNTCAVCGAEIIKAIEIDPSKHSFVSSTVPATCTADGSVTTKCEYCSKIYSTTVIKAKGHTAVSLENGVEATCTADGREADVICSECNEIVTSGAVIPAKGHTEVSADNKVEATCTTDGHESDTVCAVCSAVLSEGSVIKATGHYSVIDIESYIAPSCTAFGKEKNVICKNCGEILEEGAQIPMLEHDYDVWHQLDAAHHTRECKDCAYQETADCEFAYSIEVAPTYTQTGIGRYTCKGCGASYTEVIPVNPCAHGNTRLINAVEVSCTVEGYTGDTYCDDCERIIATGDYIEMLEHTPVSADNAVEPKCLKDGKESDIICDVCKETLVVGAVISATGHTEISAENSVAPSCTESGKEADTICSVCGETVKIGGIIAPTGHTEVEAGNYVAPSCTVDGKESDIICGVCKELLSEGAVIPAKHKYVYSIDEDGHRVAHCSECDYEKVESVCIINLTDKTISTSDAKPALAVFSVSEKGNEKLDINPDGEFEFELCGIAENLTIDVNADKDVDIKLAGVTINNDGRDAFDIKKIVDIEVTDAEGNVSTRIPEVSISAKDGTVNSITVTTSGNAIENDCELSFKGHGTLDINTVSTSINASAKINIKNLTMSITSDNRGIDTKTDVTVVNPITNVETITTNYYNIKIGADAKLTINSADDCIRCKNMEIPAINVDGGEKASVIKLTSTGGDGIQIEGGTGFTANSGDITISAAKYAFNCKEKKINIAGTAKVDASGSTNYCKPEA